MKIGKMLIGIGAGVGAAVLAPVVLPAIGAAAAAAGTAVASSSVGAAVISGASAAASAVGSAAAAAGTAVASSSVGAAIGSGMAAVGSAVGSAAGAVGLTSVATVTGTAAGAAAVGTITTAGAVAVGGTASGAEKLHRASGIAEEAKSIYDASRRDYDKAEAAANKDLEELGRRKIEIWHMFERFEELFNKIQNLTMDGKAVLDDNIHLDADKLGGVHLLALSAGNVIKDGVISLSAGQLIGAASASGITGVATASTGTAIASLHGAAAYNASMAALGGGALSAGGLGMAGGAVVANILAFAPAAAIGGLFLSGRGSRSLKDAQDSKNKADDLAASMREASVSLEKLSGLCRELSALLGKYAKILDGLLDWLEELTDRECDARLYSPAETAKCYTIYRVVEVLYDLTTAQLYSVKNDRVELHDLAVREAMKKAEADLSACGEAV